MKTFVLVIISVLALQLQSVQAASPEEVKFVVTVKQAFEKHDAAVLVTMTCWDRVPDKFKDSGKKQYARDVAQKATDIALTDPDPQYPDIEWKDKDGVSYRSNLPVIKQLKVTFSAGTSLDTKAGNMKVRDAVYPVGEKDGKLYLLKPAPIK